MVGNRPPHTILERHHLYTALGIRFRDAVIGRNADDLVVHGQRVNDRNELVGRRIPGRRTESGVYAFFGLHPAEQTRDAALEHALPQHRAVITVSDPRRRYLPIAFTMTLPHKGVFTGKPALLPAGLEADLGVHLLSAPSRPKPEGMAVVRGQIVVGEPATNPSPARFALVKIISEELRLDTGGGGNGNGGLSAIRVPANYYGMTDANGVLNLPFSYPAISDGDTSSPLASRVFSLALEIYYNPVTQADEPLPPSVRLDNLVPIPNFASLISQERARIGIAYDHSTETLTIPAVAEDYAIQLAYETPLTLRTPTTPPGSPDSVFRILPG